MIIDCVNCSKKFNVNSELIPEHGRQIKCGSCDYIWHFKKDNSLEKMPAITHETPDTNQSLEKNDINRYKGKKINYFFSYLIVFIISFVSFIILIDTVKSPLINLFPGLEVILFNLFEILKDIKLFIIDLT